MNSQEDVIQLWNKFLSGDKSAFSQIYKFYVKDLTLFGFKITNKQDLINDALQELFVSLWTKRSKLPEVKHVKSYLIISLRNLLLRRIQESQKTKIYNIDEFLINALSADEETHTEAELLSQLIKTRLELLPSRQREILHLKYYQNLSHDEIAAVMNINYQSVANLLSRSIHKLQDIWAEQKTNTSS